MKTASILLTSTAIFAQSDYHHHLPHRARDIGGRWHKLEKVWQYQPDAHREVQELYFDVFGRENVSAKSVDYPVRVVEVQAELTSNPLPIRCALPADPEPEVQPRESEVQPRESEVQPREYSQADFVRALLEAERDLYQRRIEDIDAKLLAMSKPVLVEEIKTVEAQPVQKPRKKAQRKSVACPF